MIENKNNFGLLRLLLAILVIISHSPEIIDGNESREVLTSIFGTVTFGMLAVDGFFLISGYLILKSFQNSSSIKSYLIKRCLRIYPAFIVASLICIFIFAPLSEGGKILLNDEPSLWFNRMLSLLVLKVPVVEGAFSKNYFPELNASMWTIKYEFICYLILPLLYFLKLVNKKYFIGMLCLTIFIFLIFNPATQRTDFVVLARFLCAFLVGGCFYLYRDNIEFNIPLTMISLIGVTVCLFSKFFAEIGIIIFGGYLLFNFALNYKNKLTNAIGEKTDISYGVYLYAWPVQSLFVQYFPTIEPYQLTFLTLMIVAPLAFLSFTFVEKPFVDLIKDGFKK